MGAEACRSAVSAAGDPSPQPVRWMLPESVGDRRALDRWCDGVGPAVVTADDRRPRSSTAGSELVVVTWNVHVGGGDLIALVEQLRAGRFTGGQPVEHFVLLLQEAYRRGPLVPADDRPGLRAPRSILPHRRGQEPPDIVDAAAALRLELFYAPSMRNGRPGETDEDRGNAILSTEPLSDLSAIELPFERQRRVALAATVEGLGADGRSWTMRVTNAHLDNLGGARRLWIFSVASRLKQVRGLLSHMPPAGPAIVGGDLNTWFGFSEPAYRALARAFSGEARSDRRPTFARLRLDHLLFRLPDAWESITTRLDNFGSDHHPLLARIRMAPD